MLEGLPGLSEERLSGSRDVADVLSYLLGLLVYGRIKALLGLLPVTVVALLRLVTVITLLVITLLGILAIFRIIALVALGLLRIRIAVLTNCYRWLIIRRRVLIITLPCVPLLRL